MKKEIVDTTTYGVIDKVTGKLAGVVDKKKPSDYRSTWKNLTKLMLKNYSAIEIIEDVYNCAEEVSDEQWFENKYPRGFFKEEFEYPKRKSSVIKANLKKAILRKTINDNLKIIEVAESYGIIVKNKKAICPFHKDTDPSLVFYTKENNFYCFGCKAKGNIINFIKKMEEINDNNK